MGVRIRFKWRGRLGLGLGLAVLAVAAVPWPPKRDAPPTFRKETPSAARAAQQEARLSAARLERITRRYLGTPYRLDALGEGRPPDPDPIYRRDCVDCQTLVEQTLAEALAPTPDAVRQTLIRLRYHGGRVRYHGRLHYCLPEWLENPWPVRSITRQVGGRAVRPLRGTIHRPQFLMRRGVPAGVAQQYPPLRVDTVYLPSTSVPWLQSRIPAGTIAVFILRAPNGFAGHMGWLFRRGEQVILRHASQRFGRVVDQPLVAFLERSRRRFKGLTVLQPDLRRWEAGEREETEPDT